MGSRVIEVDPERFDRWLAGFAERHGPVEATREDTPGGVVVRALAVDGASIAATPASRMGAIVRATTVERVSACRSKAASPGTAVGMADGGSPGRRAATGAVRSWRADNRDS